MVILVFVQLHVSTMYYDHHHGLPMVSCPSCEFNQGYCMNTERRSFSRTFATTIAYTSKKKILLPQTILYHLQLQAMVQVSQATSSLLMVCPHITSSSVLIKANTAAMSKRGHKCSRDRRLIRVAFFLHLLCYSLGIVGGLYSILFKAKHSKVIYSQHFAQQ